MPFTCKEEVNIQDLEVIHYNLLFLFAIFYQYATYHDLPVKVTSIMEHVDGRLTKTHAQGRAIDLSLKGWTEEHIKDVSDILNTHCKDIAAISASDGVPRAVVVHGKDENRHFHLQVKP